MCSGEDFVKCQSPGHPPDPWAFGCESLGIPCGMQFPSGGGGLSGCTYGSGSCGGMIYGWTKDANGNIIGDYPGEELCTLGPLGSCLYWNLSSGKWRPEDNATKLARAVNKTGIQSVANPCTPAAWYLASAGAAVGFSATSAGESAFPVTHTALQFLAGWYLEASEEIQEAVQTAALGAAWLGSKAVEGCSSLQ